MQRRYGMQDMTKTLLPGSAEIDDTGFCGCFSAFFACCRRGRELGPQEDTEIIAGRSINGDDNSASGVASSVDPVEALGPYSAPQPEGTMSKLLDDRNRVWHVSDGHLGGVVIKLFACRSNNLENYQRHGLSDQVLSDEERDIRNLKRIQQFIIHEYIVEIYLVSLEHPMQLIMPYYMSLQEHLQSCDFSCEEEVLCTAFYNVSRAMSLAQAHLIRLRLMHTDIKLPNILFTGKKYVLCDHDSIGCIDVKPPYLTFTHATLFYISLLLDITELPANTEKISNQHHFMLLITSLECLNIICRNNKKIRNLDYAKCISDCFLPTWEVIERYSLLHPYDSVASSRSGSYGSSDGDSVASSRGGSYSSSDGDSVVSSRSSSYGSSDGDSVVSSRSDLYGSSDGGSIASSRGGAYNSFGNNSPVSAKNSSSYLSESRQAQGVIFFGKLVKGRREILRSIRNSLNSYQQKAPKYFSCKVGPRVSKALKNEQLDVDSFDGFIQSKGIFSKI